jgi:hypothetical protein
LITAADAPFLIEDSREENKEKVEEGTGTKRIRRIELNQKITEGRRRAKKAERNLKQVEDSRE